jgi:hypothetical protein
MINRITICVILFVKALVIPFIGLAFVYYIGLGYGLIQDKLVVFYLLTNFYTPTAINMITIAIVNKFQVNTIFIT